ncbi:hypothetical protein ILUMI_26454 [Ignelater luminosus]|uniref:PiggyBac transposable element-derived protein domain-containing protein n=1 Tax=Ignelater luminosus TaxID=2038154 RepID=A0A8K0C9R7_IGNLU|nr:hypothetical protein ILUMI_26454 [Ignelater luminosus]
MLCVVPNEAPDLDAAANAVLRLSQIIPSHQKHILYFVNFHATLPLMVYLYNRGIYSLETIRANRISKRKRFIDKEIPNQSRGYATEDVDSCYGVELLIYLYEIHCTYVGVLLFKSVNDCTPKNVSRYDRTQKKRSRLSNYNSRV